MGFIRTLTARARLALGWSTIMVDSINPLAISLDAPMVAGYISGHWTWTQAGWDRFPHVKHVHIATSASVNAGDVLDCEPGDATPEQCRGWVERRIAAGVYRPTIYMNRSTWPAVQKACAGLPVDYWVADWTNKPHGLPGAAAVQFASVQAQDIDLSYVTDPNWPHLVPPPIKPKNVSRLTDGTHSISQYADEVDLIPSNILRMSSQGTWNHKFSKALSGWVNDVFTGKALPNGSMPKGLKIFLSAPRYMRHDRSKVKPYVIHGALNMEMLAARTGMTPAGILRLTAQFSPNGIYPDAVANWLNSVFRGHFDPRADIPKGLVFYVRK